MRLVFFDRSRQSWLHGGGASPVFFFPGLKLRCHSISRRNFSQCLVPGLAGSSRSAGLPRSRFKPTLNPGGNNAVRLAADANVLLSAVLGGRAKLVLFHPGIEEIVTAEATFQEVQEYASHLAQKKRLS